MRILLNGEEADACGAKTVSELVANYRLPPQTVLIEHNGIALHRHEWARQNLTEGDRIELVRVVAGG